MPEFLIDNIFAEFGGLIFQQTGKEWKDVFILFIYLFFFLVGGGGWYRRTECLLV